MSVNSYTRIWLILSAPVGFEYWALNFKPAYSLLAHFGYKASPDPGRPLGLLLGWMGISIMILMNVYTLRKRAAFMQGMGNLSSWLNFHIFCGLLGPTCILFHCNFKVRGLVAVSFWSMVMSATSGVVGRYVYVQLLGLKKDLKTNAQKWETELTNMQKAAKTPIPDESLLKIKLRALNYVGVATNNIGSDGTLRVGALHVLFATLAGDFRLFFDLPKTIAGLPIKSRNVLKRYALAERKAIFLEPFQQIMGHWHTFHTPFAFFMYIAAIIHIGAALVLGVTK